MSGKAPNILRLIAHQIHKSPLLNNASTAIGNATERAHERISILQNVASQKCGSIVKVIHLHSQSQIYWKKIFFPKHVNNATIVQNLQAAALEPSPPLPKRLVNWWNWYQKLTGMDLVEVSKHNVIKLQDQLFQCQEQRRNLTHRTSAINEKLQEIYGELLRTKREDPMYVQLTVMENKGPWWSFSRYSGSLVRVEVTILCLTINFSPGLQDYRKINEQLNFLESEERDHFTHLATAIKEYHDTQAMNAQKYKYLSVIASSLLAVISILGSMIYNNKRIAEMNKSIAIAQEKNEGMFSSQIQSLEKSLKGTLESIASQMTKDEVAPVRNMEFLNVEEGEEDFPMPELVKNITIYIGLTIVTVFVLQKLM